MRCIANLSGSNPSYNHFSVGIFGEYIGKTHCLHPHFVQVSICYIVYGKFLLTYVNSSNFLFLQELLKAHYFHLKFYHYQARNHGSGDVPIQQNVLSLADLNIKHP